MVKGKKRADEEEPVEVTIKQLAGNPTPPPESTPVFSLTISSNGLVEEFELLEKSYKNQTGRKEAFPEH